MVQLRSRFAENKQHLLTGKLLPGVGFGALLSAPSFRRLVFRLPRPVVLLLGLGVGMIMAAKRHGDRASNSAYF